MLRAVVTAGGRVDGAFAAAIGTPIKALAPLGGAVMIDAVLTAIAQAGIEHVAVVADAALAPVVAARARLVAAASDGATNVARALDAWPDGDDLLYATSDLPFVTGTAVRDFLERSAGYDLTLPLASEAAYAAAYPNAPSHVTALGGERVANGSVFFIGHRARAPLRSVAARFFDARKSALRMARLLGPTLLLRYCVRRLRIANVERRAERVLHVRAAALRDAAPELCFDVDTWEDYRYACLRR